MVRSVTIMHLAASATLAGCLCACAHQPVTASTPISHCYTESGWLDATNGCSIRAGYPDCYLVCPENGTRRKL
jgi:hypothetical protein